MDLPEVATGEDQDFLLRSSYGETSLQRLRLGRQGGGQAAERRTLNAEWKREEKSES